MSFGSKWTKTQGESVSNKILENIKPQTPLKPRIDEAQKKLQIQISKLDSISAKLRDKDKLILKRIVIAMQNHENQYAKLLSNELSQIRKMNNMIGSAKLALEQIQLRLNTITELGDVVVTLSPAMQVIKGLQGGLSSLAPEAHNKFGQISELFGNIMSDSGQIPSTEIGSVTSIDEDTLKIMEEASAIVEQSMKDKFPDLPLSEVDSRNIEASTY
jgi:division protein CdvB (Snf7/Vps24/ESCRT-III family)